MAIHRETYAESGTNAAAVTKNSSWVGRYRVRFSDAVINRHGMMNALVITNDSAQDAELHWRTHNESTGLEFDPLPSSTSLVINPDDGRRFSYFDVEDKDASTDIAIGSIKWRAAVVKELPEH